MWEVLDLLLHLPPAPPQLELSLHKTLPGAKLADHQALLLAPKPPKQDASSATTPAAAPLPVPGAQPGTPPSPTLLLPAPGPLPLGSPLRLSSPRFGACSPTSPLARSFDRAPAWAEDVVSQVSFRRGVFVLNMEWGRWWAEQCGPPGSRLLSGLGGDPPLPPLFPHPSAPPAVPRALPRPGGPWQPGQHMLHEQQPAVPGAHAAAHAHLPVGGLPPRPEQGQPGKHF